MPAKLASDGTLRMLAILTLLHWDPLAPIAVIEEPENGVHPGRLRELVSVLKDLTSRWIETDAQKEIDELNAKRGGHRVTRWLPAQVIMSSQSPVVCAALRSELSCVRFVDLVRRDGRASTRVRSVASSDAPDRGRSTVSPREIDALLDAATSEPAA